MTSASIETDRTAQAPRSLFREVLAVLLLTIGSIIPVIPWLVGVALLWTSPRWRFGDRLLGTLVWPLGYFAVLYVATVPVGVCSSGSETDAAGHTTTSAETCTGPRSPTAGYLLLTVLLVAPVVVGGLLLTLAVRRARADRAIPSIG